MSNVNQYFNQAQIARGNEMCANAIGKHTKVKLDDGIQHGKIVAASVSHASIRGRSAHMVFSVDMECGVNKTLRNFKLLTLPR